MAKTASLNATSRSGVRCTEGGSCPALPPGAPAVENERTQWIIESTHECIGMCGPYGARWDLRCGLPGWWGGGIEQPDLATPGRPGPKPPFLPGCAGLGDLPGVRAGGRSGSGLLCRLGVSGSLRALRRRHRAVGDDLAAGAGY